MRAALSLCAERLRAGDGERFAAAMAAPEPARAGLLALYACNLELARAPWASAEPVVAEMRLQWWIDALEALKSTRRTVPHEIGAALEALPAAALDGLIGAAEARRADCWSDPFEDSRQLLLYLGATSGGLMQAAGAVLGAAPLPALRDFGTGLGLANWLLAQPELTARGRLLLAGAEASGLGALARAALDPLDAAARAVRHAGPAARAAALPGYRARAVLQAAAKAPERIAAGRLAGSEFARRFALLRASLRV